MRRVSQHGLEFCLGLGLFLGLCGVTQRANAQTPGDAGAPPQVPVARPIAPAIDAGVEDAGASDTGIPDAGASDGGAPPTFDLDASHRPRLSVRVSAARIHTGETTVLTVEADALATDDLTLPSQAFAPFELHARRVHRTPRGERAVHRFELTLLALTPGRAVVPPLSLRVLTPEGDVGTLQTDPVPVEVVAWLANEPNAAAKPPTAPRRLLEEDPVPKYVLMGLAAMLVGGLLALLAVRLWQRRPKVLPPPPPPIPAWRIALDRLEALRTDGPRAIEEGRVPAWIDQLSDVVREYLGKRFGFDGLECTSNELLQRFRQATRGAHTTAELEVFLGECDLVKFAQGAMTPSQAEAMYDSAYRLVRSHLPDAYEAGRGPA